MQFLKTLFWVILAVAVAIFAIANNRLVTINLWGGLQADVKLWLLVIGPFLLGFLPLWIATRLGRWQAGRRAASTPYIATMATPAERTELTADGVLHSRAAGTPPVAGGA